ncbi:lactonase family protein [Hungatella effluvii]|uniref:lactonase family protein n=1 Tax=Hungatella effluvii TaxID=1096246 RepID=UPI0022E4ACB3|nr:beta-propeller fold lactonase family protein [Hungatella effluvii]
MNNQDLYAVFAGFSDQYWTQLTEPNFRGTCDGLTLCRMNGETGEMTICDQLHGLSSPSTVAVSPDQKYIYCGNEEHDFKGRGYGGGVTAVALNLKEEKMEVINQSLAAGSSTCYVALDKTGKYLLAANHGSKFYCSRYEIVDGEITPQVIRDEGCVSLFEIREDGGIGRLLDRVILDGTGIDPVEHASAHPHSVVIDDQDFVVIPNKGGDSIWVCKLNRNTNKLDKLSIFSSEYGSSPRHAFFVRDSPFVLVQNEYDGHLCSYSLDRENGILKRLSRVDIMDPHIKGSAFHLLTDDMHPWGLDVQVHPNGRFVYANNSQRVVCQMDLNSVTGELTVKNRYTTNCDFMTRGIQIDRDGKFLVVTCVASEKAVVYKINQQNGDLTPVSEIALPTPTALKFLYPEEA